MDPTADPAVDSAADPAADPAADSRSRSSLSVRRCPPNWRRAKRDIASPDQPAKLSVAVTRTPPATGVQVITPLVWIGPLTER